MSAWWHERKEIVCGLVAMVVTWAILIGCIIWGAPYLVDAALETAAQWNECREEGNATSECLRDLKGD